MSDIEKNAPVITPPMLHFLEYFSDLGPRWGLNSETTRLHGLLYLVGEPLNVTQICSCMDISKEVGQAAIDDLLQWGVLKTHANQTWSVEGEPWDLLFSAMQERQKREIAPAKTMLTKCIEEAENDEETPYKVKHNISMLYNLVTDLEALSKRTGSLSSSTLKNLVGVGGRAARLIDRVLK